MSINSSINWQIVSALNCISHVLYWQIPLPNCNCTLKLVDQQQQHMPANNSTTVFCSAGFKEHCSGSLIDIKGRSKSRFTLPWVNERQAGLREEKLKIELFLCMSMLSLFQSDIDFLCLDSISHTPCHWALCIYIFTQLCKKKNQKFPSDRIMERWGKYGLDLWWTVGSNSFWNWRWGQVNV